MTGRGDQGAVAAQWRRVAVGPVLAAYRDHPQVDAVMLSGSTARGDADRWSDVEVGVFWSVTPSRADREAIPEAAGAMDQDTGGDAVGRSPGYDQLHLCAPRPHGLLVEVVHSLSSETDHAIARTLVDFDPRPETLDLLKGIIDARDVAGRRADLVHHWQRWATPYPHGLTVAVVQRHGRIPKFWRTRMLAERNNPVLLSRELLRVADQMLTVLHALNGHYCGHPSVFKRLDAMERDLVVAPARLGARLREVFTDPTRGGADRLAELVEQTFDLIDTRLPDVDVDDLRAVFREERTPLDAPPEESGHAGGG